jgi:CDP-paratose synthetase
MIKVTAKDLSWSYFAVKAESRYTLKDLASIFEKVTGRKLNIIWGGRDYRKREVMEPWRDGKVVPEWKTVIQIETGIIKFMKEPK